MNSRFRWLLVLLLVSTSIVLADEPPDIAGDFQRIVADYQRIAAATDNAAAARAAAGRLTRDAYRRLIDVAQAVEEPSADDLHAMGQCHEAIGETDKARMLYNQSLKAAPAARTRLSLARVNLANNLKAADTHFAEAVKTDPEHPDLSRFRLSLAAAHQRERDWEGAIPYLEHLLGYTKTLAERTPASAQLQNNHFAVQQQLDRVRRFAGMTGNAAPELIAQHWAQGDATTLAGLKGKVVLIDFCAMWAQPSRERMELLKGMQQDGLQIIGVTLAYNHKYDAETDKVSFTNDLSTEDESAGLGEFAKKHEIPWRLAVIGQETVDEYGVATLPHTVAIDKNGNVAAILLGGPKAEEDLETIVNGLLE